MNIELNLLYSMMHDRKTTTVINCAKVISANIIDSCDKEPGLVAVTLGGDFNIILKFRIW
jgi:hypothetical protein